jgi:hypothetical protein
MTKLSRREIFGNLPAAALGVAVGASFLNGEEAVAQGPIASPFRDISLLSQTETETTTSSNRFEVRHPQVMLRSGSTVMERSHLFRKLKWQEATSPLRY